MKHRQRETPYDHPSTTELEGRPSQTGLAPEQHHHHDESALSANRNAYQMDPDANTESYMTSGVMGHLHKVYKTMAFMIGAAMIGGASFAVLPSTLLGASTLLGLVGAIACVLGVYFSDVSKIPFRKNLLLGTGFFMGLSSTLVLSMVSLPTILLALTGTTAIFAAFSLAAIRAKSTTFLQLGGLLGGGVLLLLAVSLFHLLAPMLGIAITPAVAAALHSFNLYFGLGLFSLYVAYDTQRMIASAYEGSSDYVTDALSMFINVYQIFIRLIYMLKGDD